LGSIHAAEVDPEADRVAAIVPPIPLHDLVPGGGGTVHESAHVASHHIEEVDTDHASAGRDIESDHGSIAERIGSPQVEREPLGNRKVADSGGDGTGNPEA
jgi:hypothetical protein